MKTKNILLTCTLLAVIITAGFIIKPETAVKPFAEGYLPIWKNAITSTLQVAEAMPADKYDYKPTEESKTFASQMIHIGYSSKVMTQMFLKGEKVEFNEPDASNMSKEEIIAFLEENLGQVAEIIQSMPAEAWEEEVKTFGGNMMPKSQAMIFIQDHLTNHRAKANLYIRMNDIKPPSYMYF